MYGIEIENLSLTIGNKELIQDACFGIYPKDRIGLLGRNGSGKTTLLRLIALGQDRSPAYIEKGSIKIINNTHIGYLSQHLYFEHQSIENYIKEASPRLSLIESEMKLLENCLYDKATEENIQQYSKLQEEYDLLGGYNWEYQSEKVLEGLGLSDINQSRSISSLSGGEQTKIGLARLLIEDPNILLLDEPTNNLDMEAMIWLENYLSSSQRASLIVSHDRRFLDRTVNKIFEIDEHSHKINIYIGNFTSYQEQKNMATAKQGELYNIQELREKRIKSDIIRIKGLSVERESVSKNDYLRQRNKKLAKRAKSQEKRLQQELESGKHIEKPEKEKRINIDFLGKTPKGQLVVSVKNISWAYHDSNLLYDNINFSIHGQERIAIIGKNGVGKTTLLSQIEGLLPPQTGEITFGKNIKMGILTQGHERLKLDRTVLNEFRDGLTIHEDEAMSFLGSFLFNNRVRFLKISDLSIGERSRLVIAKIMASGANLLILDEPTNHLDLISIEAVENALSDFKGSLLVVSHDRYFLDKINTSQVYFLSRNGIDLCDDGYRSYEKVITESNI